MNICFVGPANSAHIIKWCKWFSEHGHNVHVISFSPGEIENATVHLIDLKVDANGSDAGKLKYLTTGRQIKKLINDIQPDIVNAHYATSYGIAIALSGIKEYVLSVWGADIYDFPRKSPLHRALLKYSLWKAPHLFSTSKAMAKEAGKYTKKKFEITPFGVDLNLFNPDRRTRDMDIPVSIGMVKTSADLCDTDFLFRTAAIISRDNPDLRIKIRIAESELPREKNKQPEKAPGTENTNVIIEKVSKEQMASARTKLDAAAVLPEKQNERALAEEILRLYQSHRTDDNKVVFADEKGSKIDSMNSSMGLNSIESSELWADIEIRKRQDFIVGTVKSLSDKYGIADILKAAAIVKQKGTIPIKLRIAGKGPQEEEFHRLAKELGVSDITAWLGFISQNQAAEEWANMDVAIIPSTLESESFGVSAVEAQASGTAVIISDIPGLMEATKPGESAVVVRRNDPEAIAQAICSLYENKSRITMAHNGRQYVRTNYEINQCFIHICRLFEQLAGKEGKDQ